MKEKRKIKACKLCISNLDIETLQKRDWYSLLYNPKKYYGYIFYRNKKHKTKHCVIIAKFNDGIMATLPWYNTILKRDMRKKLRLKQIRGENK